MFSNINGDFNNQAQRLLDRKDQNSCSLISSEFIAIYGGIANKIGFIYPSDSHIIMASANDLGSNVFGTGTVNSEKGTLIATPVVLEQIGKKREKEKNEDNYSSTCYNEVLVDSNPCGILILGYGEKDINIDYDSAIGLSHKLNLPVYQIDLTKYKKGLSENDKKYISYHSLM